MKHLGHSQSSQTKQKKPDPPRTHVDLFSGIGGFALGARWAGVQTVAFCDTDEYAKKVLRKNFEGVPVFHDVRDFPSDEFSRPWLLTGSWPCQPFSRAGNRRGDSDDRHLWKEMFKIIRSSRPVWVIGENVTEFIEMGLDEVLSDLESENYSVQTFSIPAAAINAPHKRERIFVVANSGRFEVDSLLDASSSKGSKETAPKRIQESSDSDRNRDWIRRSEQIFERRMDRVSDGIPSRLDRMRTLGNAIVPGIAFEIINMMIQVEEPNREIEFFNPCGEQHENQS